MAVENELFNYNVVDSITTSEARVIEIRRILR